MDGLDRRTLSLFCSRGDDLSVLPFSAMIHESEC